jgi:hypothetical protein
MEFTHTVPVPNQARHVRAAQADCSPTPVDRAAPDHAPHPREEQSHDVRIGLNTFPPLPGVFITAGSSVRLRLFDMVEYAPSETDAFEQIVTGLRTSPEWEFVDREVDIRLARVDA